MLETSLRQAVSRTGFFSLAGRRLSSPSVLTGPPSVHVCVLISSYKDTSPVGLGPTLMTSFYLNYLFKDPSPNTVTF